MFDRVYRETPCYFGSTPSEELEAFLCNQQGWTGKALDLGCGEGRDSFVLARNGFEVVALDISQTGIEKLRDQAAATALPIACSVCDARQYDFPIDAFDFVSCVTLLDHLTPNEGAAVIEGIKRSLRPLGHVFVEVFTVDDPGYMQRKSIDLVSECASAIQHYFEKEELRAHFADFEVLQYKEEVELDTSHGPPHHHGIAVLLGRKRP